MLRIVLLPALIVLALFAAPASASASADDCKATPGMYSVIYGRDRVAQHADPTFFTVATVAITGSFDLNVNCDGGATIVTPKTTATYNIKNINVITVGHSGLPDGGGNRQNNYVIPMTFSNASVHMENGLPIVTVTVTNGGVACPNDALACIAGGITETWTLRTKHPDPEAKFAKQFSGSAPFNAASAANHSSMYDGEVEAMASANATNVGPMYNKQGSETGAVDAVTISIVSSPIDAIVSQELEQVFLSQEPSVIVKMRAFVDKWGPPAAKGGDVLFTLDGKPFADVKAGDMSQGGKMAEAPLEVGNLAPGNYAVEATVKNSLGQSSKFAAQHPLTIIATPQWARKLTGFKPIGVGPCHTPCEQYEGTKKLPDKPINFSIEIPAIVPIVGGQWGIKPTQFNITPLPRSLVGGKDPGTVSGGGSFGVGDKVFSLSARSDSKLTTTTTMTGLSMDGDIRFDPAAVSYQKHFGPSSLFAAIGGIVSPDFASWLNSIDPIGVDAIVTAGMEGSSLQFTAAQADQDVKISSFATTLTLAASVNPNANIGIAEAGVFAQLNGSLALDLSPVPKVKDCSFSLYTFAYYATLWDSKLQEYPPEPALTQIANCTKQTAVLTPLDGLIQALDAANRTPLFATASAAESAGPSVPARLPSVIDRLAAGTATAGGGPSGRKIATLVYGAPSNAAAPAIASGPNGRRAMVWIGENLHAARPIAWQTRLRLFDGHQWSATAPFLGDGKRPNAIPTVAFDGNGDVVVAWSVDETPNVTASTPTSVQAPNVHVEVAVCDGRTGAVKARRVISAGAGPDAFARAVAASDGSVWVAWQNIAPGEYASPAATSRIVASVWDRKAWSAPETIVSAAGLQSWQLAARDRANAVLVYDATLNKARSVHSLTRTHDRWSETLSQTAAPVVGPRVAAGYAPDGSAHVAWVDGANIMSAAGNAAKVLVANAGGMPAGFAADATSISTLVVSAAGYANVVTDTRNGLSAAPVRLATSAFSLSPSGIARSGSNWLIITAPLPPISPKTPTAPAFGGVPIVLNSAQ